MSWGTPQWIAHPDEVERAVRVLDQHGERPATPEEQAAFELAIAPTDPAMCECGHGGLERGFHTRHCPVRAA